MTSNVFLRWRGDVLVGVLAISLSVGCAVRTAGGLGADSSSDAMAPPPSPGASKPPAPGGALGELDRLFLEAYAERRDTWVSEGPVVVVLGSSLELKRAGHQPERQRVIPDLYHALKSVAHLPFAAYLRLSPYADGTPFPKNVTAALSSFQSKITASREALSKFDLTADQLSRQMAILDRVERFIELHSRSGVVSRSELEAFAADAGARMLQNADEAGCSQVLATHEQMLKWKAQISPIEWSTLTVLNRGGHQARYRNAATQYFAWLLDEPVADWSYPGESMRVVYVEGLRPDEDALDLAAAVDIDADASRAFFGDPWRLSEDILSEGAERCINSLQRP